MYHVPHLACNHQSAIISVDLLQTSDNSALIILGGRRDLASKVMGSLDKINYPLGVRTNLEGNQVCLDHS